VQYPKYSQSLNRYAYVVNNPLSYTDPSGFGFFSELLDFHHKIDPITRMLDNIVAKSTTLQQIGGVAAGVASAIYGPWIAAAYSAHITNLKGGSTFDTPRPVPLLMELPRPVTQSAIRAGVSTAKWRPMSPLVRRQVWRAAQTLTIVSMLLRLLPRPRPVRPD
jgi:hypothetical protein